VNVQSCYPFLQVLALLWIKDSSIECSVDADPNNLALAYPIPRFFNYLSIQAIFLYLEALEEVIDSF
jgi:hypothetical protein